LLNKKLGPEVFAELQRMGDGYMADVAEADRLETEGDYDRAEAALRALEGKHPSFDGDVIMRLVRVSMRQELWDRALVETERLSQNSPEVVFLRGVCLGMTGRYDYACYERAMESLLHFDSLYDYKVLLPPPGRPLDLAIVCAYAYRRSGGMHSKLGAQMLRLAASLDPVNPVFQSGLGHLMWASGHYLAAKEHFERAAGHATGELKDVILMSIDRLDWLIKLRKR
jgi:hypothetical protein